MLFHDFRATSTVAFCVHSSRVTHAEDLHVLTKEKKTRHPSHQKSRFCQLTNCPNCTLAQSCKRGSQVSLQWIPSCVGGVRLVWNRCWAEEEGEGAFSLQPVYVLAAASALLPNTPEPHLTNLPTVYQSADQGIQKHFHVRSILVSMVGGLWPPLGERGLMFYF